uniref:Proline rich 5 like n=1 Tax=Capra hircus TaxID=9925 RepID=A0A8C2RN76_CAPHI
MGELITQLWYSSSISFAACEARCPDLPPLLLEIGSPVAALWRWFTHKVNEGAEVPLGFPSPPPFSNNLGWGRAFLGPRKAQSLPRPGLSACVAGKHASSLCVPELGSRICDIKDCLTVFLSLSRRLLKSELGSFITDYFQNQLLAKGLLFVEEKIKLCEGENRIEVLAEVWDHFFTETLPTLQAIFYPVQGQELTIRQISLLGFRDLVLLKVKLEDLLLLAQPQPPSSIVQMLLILQSVHEPTGPSEGYLQLEELVKQVVSPFLGISEDRGLSGPTYTLARRHSRVRPKVTLLNYASPVTPVSRPLNEMALTPLTEQEGEAYLEKCGSVRRHTVANAHSDIQLLAMATMMHSGLGEEPGGEDKCLLLQPSFPPPHRQCSSEPNITDGPDEPEQGATGSQEDSELNCASLS